MLTFSLSHINSVYGSIIKKRIRTGTSSPCFAFKKEKRITKEKMLKKKKNKPTLIVWRGDV